jgi:hypothetical protein
VVDTVHHTIRGKGFGVSGDADMRSGEGSLGTRGQKRQVRSVREKGSEGNTERTDLISLEALQLRSEQLDSS